MQALTLIASFSWRNLISISVKEHNCTLQCAHRKSRFLCWSDLRTNRMQSVCLEVSRFVFRSSAFTLLAYLSRLYSVAGRRDPVLRKFALCPQKRQKWWNGTIIAAPVACNQQISKVGCKEKFFHCFIFCLVFWWLSTITRRIQKKNYTKVPFGEIIGKI